MVCRQFGAKPLPEPTSTYCQLDPYEQTSVQLEWKFKLFIHANAVEDAVCEMAAFLSRADELNTKVTGDY